MPDADVLIVGGGLAGLVAARDLAEAGRRAVVLEARDRIGGRTWTTTLPGTDVAVEYGGTWVHPESQRAVAAEIERYGLEMRTYREPGVGVFISGGERRVGAGDAGLREAFAAFDDAFEGIGRRFAEGDRETAYARLSDLDVPVTAWLDTQDVPVASRDAFLAFAAAMGGGPPSELALLPLVLDGIDNGYAMDSGWSEIGVSFAGGTRALVAAIGRDLDIRLGHVVAAVTDDGSGDVTVHLEGGARLTARAAIIALPLNVWADVAFDPPLAGGKAGAARHGHAGHSSKVLAVARNVPDSLAGIGWDVPLQALFSMGEVGEPGSGQRLLTGFGGAHPIDPNDQGAVTEAIRAYAPDAEVVAFGGHDWNADPFSKGTWFAPPVGWHGITVGEDLETPVGRLAFAGGDLPEIGAGWIEGALASGGRAASRVGAILDAAVPVSAEQI